MLKQSYGSYNIKLIREVFNYSAFFVNQTTCESLYTKARDKRKLRYFVPK